MNDNLVKELSKLTQSIEILTEKVIALEDAHSNTKRKLKKQKQRVEAYDAYFANKESRSTARFYPFHKNFFAGAVALPVAFAFTHPLDTIKTRMQALSQGTVESKSFASHLKAVFKAPGLGFLPSVLGMFYYYVVLKSLGWMIEDGWTQNKRK